MELTPELSIRLLSLYVIVFSAVLAIPRLLKNTVELDSTHRSLPDEGEIQLLFLSLGMGIAVLPFGIVFQVTSVGDVFNVPFRSQLNQLYLALGVGVPLSMISVFFSHFVMKMWWPLSQVNNSNTGN